ncbi:MAG: heterodisulfide reductase-related iron-sulfur binding cluster [Promethearchaeota archaeon]
MGCLSTIRIPRYTEHALEYLIKKKIDFTILEKEVCCGYPAFAAGLLDEYKRIIKKNKEIWKSKGFEKIICLCPACFVSFNQDYELDKENIKVEYIVDYLTPSPEKKKGSVSIQHLCQLMNRGYKGYEDKVNRVLKESGYDLIEIPHWCCGGGIGYFGRTDVIDKIAEIRLKDFKGNYYTTYCSGCFWILKAFKRHLIDRKQTKLKDIFQLLI